MHGMNDTQTVKLMNSSLSLVHACVATLAALAGEILLAYVIFGYLG